MQRVQTKREEYLGDEGAINFWLLLTRIAPGATMLLMAVGLFLRPSADIGVLRFIADKIELSPDFLAGWLLIFGALMLFWNPPIRGNLLFSGGLYILLTAPLLFFCVVGVWYPLFVKQDAALTDAVAWFACYMFLGCIYFLSLSLSDWYQRLKTKIDKAEKSNGNA